MKHRVVNVTEFKAKCLALLDDIVKRGETITMTKRGLTGRPRRTCESVRMEVPGRRMGGEGKIADDLLDAGTSGLSEVLRERKGARR